MQVVVPAPAGPPLATFFPLDAGELSGLGLAGGGRGEAMHFSMRLDGAGPARLSLAQEQTFLGTFSPVPIGSPGLLTSLGSGSRYVNSAPHLAGLAFLFAFQSLSVLVSHITSRDFAVLTGTNGEMHVFSSGIEISCTVFYHFLRLCQKLSFLCIPIFPSAADPLGDLLQQGAPA